MTDYPVTVLIRLLHDLGLWDRRYHIASRIAGRPVRSLDELSTREQHDMIRGLRIRALVP